MAKLEMRFLGGLSLSQDGIPLVGFSSEKGKALLCYLTVTGRPHARTSLTGLLWPERSEENARASLRKLLSELRKHVPAYLVATRQTVAIDPDTPVWVDAIQFERSAASAENIADLQEAIALYRGDFLDQFFLPDAPAFDRWVLSQRVRLRLMAIEALHSLAFRLAAQQDYESAITYARQLLDIEPWRESGHRELMRYLALNGQRSAALRQYEMCRRILDDELSAAPSSTTADLYEQIKANQVVPVLVNERWRESVVGRSENNVDGHSVPPSPVLTRHALPPHNLPAQTTPLIGRTEELAQLMQLLAQPDKRLVTIVAAGGMGKTRLALAAARKQLKTRSYANGVFMISLAPLSHAAALLPALAEALTFTFQSHQARSPRQQILDYLAGKQMLLLFDNFEHLLDEAGLVDAILQAAAGVKVLVTSREPLRLYTEQLFPLAGLSFNETRVALEDAAVELFLHCVRRFRPDLIINQHDLVHLTTICRHLTGMPLGLELAATWVDTLPLSHIATELHQGLDLLETDLRNVPERQRSMRAVIDASWQRLNETEQRIFAGLSGFRRGFTRDAAAAVCAPEMSTSFLRRVLVRLTRQSFLNYNPTIDRYEIHELMRQYGDERLKRDPSAAHLTHDRHSTYFCALLEAQAENWHTDRQLETVAIVTQEAENVQLAWQWALAQKEWKRLSGMLESLKLYYVWRGRVQEARTIFQIMAETAEGQVTETIDTPSDCLHLWACALFLKGATTLNARAALDATQQSLILWEQLERNGQDVQYEKAKTLLALGEQLSRLDQPKSRQLTEQSLALFNRLGYQRGTGLALRNLSQLDWLSGHYETALERGQTALVIAQERGDRAEQAYCMLILGLIYKVVGHLDEAEHLERKALGYFQQLGHPTFIVHGNLTYTLVWQGNFDAAQQEARKCLMTVEALSDREDEGHIRYLLAEALLHSGQYHLVGAQASKGLTVAQTYATQDVEALLHGVLGELALAEHAYDKAQLAFAKNAEIMGQIQYGFADLSAGKGYVACHLGQLQEARHCLAEALSHAVALKGYMLTLFPLPGVALLFTQMGEVIRAVEIWELARTQPFVANSDWFRDVAGRAIEAAAATLPLDVVAAARERGQTWDIWQTAAMLLEELQS